MGSASATAKRSPWKISSSDGSRLISDTTGSPARWQLFGALLGAPKWLVDVTPFAHVGLVPAQSFDAAGAVVMSALGALCAVGAIWLFERRDLTGS
jgi:hypothetical protein